MKKNSIFFGKDLGAFISILLFIAITLPSCNNNNRADQTNDSDSLTEEQAHSAENALRGLKSFEGLEVHTMATEPMLKNPTNIDVDERGRVWVTEAYNYRPASMVIRPIRKVTAS